DNLVVDYDYYGGVFLKKIKIIEMGGTISAEGTDRLDRQNYISGIYTGETFIKDLPELEELADVDFFSFSHVSSTELDQTHWLKLRSLIAYFINKQNYRSEEHTSELQSRFDLVCR